MTQIPASDASLPTEWFAAYPGTRYLSEGNVMAWSPRGVLDISRAEGILHWLEAVEPRIGDFNRFIDLTQISKVELGASDVVELANRRKAHYAGAPVKTAILATSPLAYGIARMYEQLVASGSINVHVVSQLSIASEILKVPAAVLEQFATEP